jgi:hypothetical protein
MTGTGTRLLWTVLSVTVVTGFAVSVAGCASLGPTTPMAVSDLRSAVAALRRQLWRQRG